MILGLNALYSIPQNASILILFYVAGYCCGTLHYVGTNNDMYEGLSNCGAHYKYIAPPDSGTKKCTDRACHMGMYTYYAYYYPN